MKATLRREALIEELQFARRVHHADGAFDYTDTDDADKIGSAYPWKNSAVIGDMGGSFGIRVRSSNTDSRAFIDADVSDGFVVSVSAQHLLYVLSAMTGDEICITTSPFAVECGNVSCRLVSSDASDIKPWAKTPRDITQIDLPDIVSTVVFAASDDESRYGICGVYLDSENGKLRAVATNGHVLAIEDTNVSTGANFKQIIVPLKLAECGAGTLQIWSDKAVAHIRDNREVRFKLSGEDFVEYRTVIPARSEHQITVDTIDARFAARFAARACMSARKIGNIKPMLIHRGKWSSALSDFGADVTVILTADITGSPPQIGINAEYLLSVLTHIEAPRVTIELTETLRPITIRDNRSTYVIMSMRLE